MDDFPVELEAMLDTHGLGKLLTTLSTIAAEKAEHLRSNWQDENAAKAWERTAAWLDKQTTAREVVECPLA